MILEALTPAVAAQYEAVDDFWFTEIGARTLSGIALSPERALTYAAVFACVRVIAETLGHLPKFIMRRIDDRTKVRDLSHPLHALIHDSPNEWQTAPEFFEMLTGHLALRGNCYVEIVPGPRGFADQLVPMHPDRTTPVLVPGTNRLAYRHARPDGRVVTLTSDEVWHVRGLSSDGFLGLSVLELARSTIGFGLDMDQYGNRFFANDARPAIALMHPKGLTSDAKERIEESWVAKHGGVSNAHRPAVLAEGMTIEKIGLSNEDSQWVEAKDRSVRDVCRWFRMQPHKIGDLSDATFSNIEMQSIEHKNDTILPWAVRWEKSGQKNLILAPQTYSIEIVLEGLLRGDTATRYEAYSKSVGGPWETVNEVRSREGKNPVDGGDELLSPLNMGAAGASTSGSAALRLARDLLRAASERIVRREVNAIRGAAGRLEAESFAGWAEEFFREHARYIESALRVDSGRSIAYCAGSEMAVGNAHAAGRLEPLLENWSAHKAAALCDMGFAAAGVTG